MDKYLLFNEQATAADIGDAAHDVACYPLSKFKGFTNTSTTDTHLHMIFEGLEEGSADGDASSVDTITLTITANKQVEAMKDISNAISSNISGVIVIADVTAGATSFASTRVTGVSIAVSSAD